MRRRRVLTGAGASLLAFPSNAATRDLTICAHRGWRDPSQTENSLDEMRRTLRAGPFMMEIDLARDADATLVLSHDQTVDRATTGHGSVARMKDDALARLRLKNAKGATPESVPHYLDVLRWAASEPSARLMLDIKDIPPSAALAPVRELGLSRRVLVLTFRKDMAIEAFAADADALVSVLTPDRGALEMYRRLAGHRRFAAYIPSNAAPDVFRIAHDLGAVVITDLLGRNAVEDSMNPEEGARFIRSRPVDIIVTNTPLRLQQALDGHDGGR